MICTHVPDENVKRKNPRFTHAPRTCSTMFTWAFIHVARRDVNCSCMPVYSCYKPAQAWGTLLHYVYSYSYTMYHHHFIYMYMCIFICVRNRRSAEMIWSERQQATSLAIACLKLELGCLYERQSRALITGKNTVAFWMDCTNTRQHWTHAYSSP